MKFRLAILFLSLFMLMHKVSFGQDLFMNSSKSYQQTPNSAKLGEFGKFDVSPYSGQIDLKIPLKEFKYKDIIIPLFLKYNTSGNKVNDHPGFVGLGWTLMAGGAITRIVNDRPDEISKNELLYYYPGANIPDEPGYFYRGRELYKESNLDNDSLLFINYLGVGLSKVADSEPDEFIFNFCGYSGTFYINPEGISAKKAVSSSIYIVDIIPELSSSDEKGFDAFNCDGSNQPPTVLGGDSYFRFRPIMFRHFKGFTILLNNGDKYYFGGDYSSVEYTSSVKQSGGVQEAYLLGNPTSWMLKKIIRVNGDVVNFEYARLGTPMVVSDNFNYCGYDYVDPEKYTKLIPIEKQDYPFVIFQHPLYLKKIESGDGLSKIEFKYSLSSQLEYTLRDEHCKVLEPLKNYLTSSRYSLNSNTINLCNYWMQLDEIIFNEKSKCQFNYTRNANERLKLLSISNMDKNNRTYGSYTFTYDASLLPAYNTRATDNWGYYNGKTYRIYDVLCTDKAKLNNLYNIRNSDFLYAQSEILKTIKYPTGGVSTFEFQLNDYSRYVNKRGQPELINETGKGGGLRIRKIVNRDMNNNFLENIQYNYVNEKGESSGILSGKPIYNCIGSVHLYAEKNKKWWEIFEYTYHFDQKWNVYLASENGLSSLTLSNLNAITYSRVEEVKQGNGKNVYYFDNHDSFLDDVPQNNYTNWNDFLFIDATISKKLERGRQKRIEMWNEKGDLVKQVDFYYNSKAARYNSYLRAFKSTFYNLKVYLERCSAYKVFTFNPFLEKKITTEYNVSGAPTVTEEFYSYNADNLLSETIRNESNGQQVKQKRRYVSDILPVIHPIPIGDVVRFGMDDTLIALDKMRELSMVGYPIEEVKSVISNGSEKVVDARVNLYRLNNSLPVLSEVRGLNIAAGIEDYKGIGCFQKRTLEYEYWNLKTDPRLYPLERYTRYDEKSNLQEVVGKNGLRTSYLWDYNGSNIIAVANNMSYDALMGIAGVVPNTTNEVSMMDYLQGLRSRLSASPALLTTYTYHPFVGLTSATNPQGITTLYRYDPMGRLSHVLEKDNVLASYYYSYCNQIATEKYFSSAAASQVFTKACPSGDAGSSVTYTVPAGRYTSMICQADADAQAQADISSNGQNYANEKGTCFYLNPISLSTNFGKNGGVQTIQIASNTKWIATTSSSWITVTSTSTDGVSPINITCSANSGGTRTGLVTLQTTPAYGGITKVITVNQEANSFLMAQDIFHFDWVERSFDINVSSSSSWSIVSREGSFITAGKINEQTLRVTLDRNIGTQRSGSITISNGSRIVAIKIYQAAWAN